jgi:hypothetical protein
MARFSAMGRRAFFYGDMGMTGGFLNQAFLSRRNCSRPSRPG